MGRVLPVTGWEGRSSVCKLHESVPGREETIELFVRPSAIAHISVIREP